MKILGLAVHVPSEFLGQCLYFFKCGMESANVREVEPPFRGQRSKSGVDDIEGTTAEPQALLHAGHCTEVPSNLSSGFLQECFGAHFLEHLLLSLDKLSTFAKRSEERRVGKECRSR